MLRRLVLLLAVANLVFFAWAQGLLRGIGLGPVQVGEPQRLSQQIHPERLQLLAPASAPAASAATPPPRPH
jgi:hypothetical protein